MRNIHGVSIVVGEWLISCAEGRARRGDFSMVLTRLASPKHFWTWSRGKDGGSNETYCHYHVPKDVPRNENVSIRIEMSGDVGKILHE